MNDNPKYIFYFFVIFCFLTQPFCFLEANQIDVEEFARKNPYRRGEVLCYAATYHGEMPEYFEQHISRWRFVEPSIRDSELEEGLEEWRLMDKNAIRNAPLFGNTNDVSVLIEASGFEQAIKECAERRGLVFDDLLKNMRNTLLRINRLGTFLHYRRGELLCYAATYHGEMPEYFEQHISRWRLVEPSIRDSELEKGLEEWRLIDKNAIRSTFLVENTNDVSVLIKASGFEQAIKECAESKGLVFDDLLENMRNTLLRMDRLGTFFGRNIQLFATEPVWGRAARWGFGLLKRGVSRWISTSQIRSWIGIGTTASQGITPQVRSQISLVGRSRGLRRTRSALGIGALGITAITRDSDIVLASIEEDISTKITEENVEGLEGYFMGPLELIDISWFRRWLNTEGAIYRTIIEMFYEHKLDIDHLDNQTTLPHDLAILIDTYFVDYDYVNRKLEASKALKGEHHQDTVDLSLVRELFDWRWRQLENQTDGLPERAVAFELLSLAEDNSSFLCLFSQYNNLPDDNRSDVLCKIHLFYTTRNYQRLSQGAALELERLEVILENL